MMMAVGRSTGSFLFSLFHFSYELAFLTYRSEYILMM